MTTLQEKIIAVLKNPNAQYNDFSKVIDEGLASGEIIKQNNQSSFQLGQSIFSQYKKDAGLNDSNLKLWKDTQYRKWRTARDSQDYGTFIAPQTGKQVVMHTPEDLKNALVLGFKKVKEGSTMPTPEEVAMIQAAGYKGEELQASLDAYNKANPKVQGVQQTYDPNTGQTTYADGRVEQSTAPRLTSTSPLGKKLGQLQYLRQDDGLLQIDAWGGNNKYGFTEISKDEFIKGVQQQIADVDNPAIRNKITDKAYLQGLIAKAQSDTGQIQKGYENKIIDASGNLVDLTVAAKTAEMEALVAKGVMKKVPVGNGFGYLPVGSAGDLYQTDPNAYYAKYGNPQVATYQISGQQQPMGDAIYNINGKLMSAAAAQQSGIDISKFSPVSGGVTDQVRGATMPTQNNLTMASAGQDPNITPTSTAPTTPQINFKSGLNDAQKQSITNLISKGSVLNENDAKNLAYAMGINDYTQFVGKTGQEAIGSSAGQPTRDTMQANVMQVAQTQPMQKATTDFISQAFESIHGRPPEPDEIARYQNKTTADALTEIQGGAPQPVTQADLDLMNQGFERILNPQSLEDLKAAGLDPTKIVKVGNKLYKPGSFSVDSSSAAMPSEFTGAKGTLKTDGLTVGGNAKYTAGVTAAANDYYGQYLEQIAPQFYADRQAYWNSVLTSSDFREKTLLNLEDKYQLDELSKNLTDIDAKIAAKNTAYSTLLNDIENQPMSMARIIGEGNHVRKLQAVEINSLLAQREAIQGNYDRAEKMMTNMYNAKVADYTDNIAAMKDWYSEQKDFFTKQEQRSYDAKIKEEERNFELYKDNLKTVQEMAMKYPMAGITLNDDFDTALEKTIPSYIQALELEYNKDKNYQFVKGENGVNYVFDPATGSVTTTGGTTTGGNDIQSNILKLGLKTVPIGGKQITGNSLFTDLLTKADADMRAAGLGGLQINQDYRTSEEQAALYQKLSATGGRVAPPETSFHEKGLAIDVTNWQAAAPFLKKYGIVNGLPDDMGHFSVGEMNPGVFNDLAKLYPEIAPQLTNEQALLKSTSDLITNTLSHSGLGESVGPTKLTRVDLNPLTGAKEEFIANINQITAKSTLDALLNLKKAGGTLGALGEKEQEMLQNAAAKFKSWEIKDSTGKVVGYDISETAFKNELTNIQNLTNIALKNAGYTTQNDYALSSDILKNYGLTQ